jgi:hypothetical protein
MNRESEEGPGPGFVREPGPGERVSLRARTMTKFSLMDNLGWAAAFATTCLLLAVMLVRGRWRQFPALTAVLVFDITRTITLFLLHHPSTYTWYAHIYWWALVPDFALQLAVAFEIARIVLRPTGTWVHDARTQFLIAGAGGMVVAALLAWWVTPPAQTALRAWGIRGNLFTSLVICELFVAVSLTANRLGLGWRHHVMAVGQGFTAWSGITLLNTALQSYLGQGTLFRLLDDLRGNSFSLAMVWIAIQLWLPEPERQPLAPELQRYILALHQRVAYDLRRIDAHD